MDAAERRRGLPAITTLAAALPAPRSSVSLRSCLETVEEETEMLRKGSDRPALAAAAAAFSGTIAAAQALLPAVAPSLPPTFVVDLMTREGSAAFGAQWKTLEAKIVAVPAIPEAIPEFKTTNDIEPHAGESGFDDSSRSFAAASTSPRWRGCRSAHPGAV